MTTKFTPILLFAITLCMGIQSGCQQANPNRPTTSYLAIDTAANHQAGEMDLKLKRAGRLTGKAEYPQAYDQIWEVLHYADYTDNDELKYKAYKKLAMLYSIFNYSEKAQACVDSMFSYFNGQAHARLKNYYTAAIISRMDSKYEQASAYLDTCFHIIDSISLPFKDQVYMISERALIASLQDKFGEAEQLLGQISAHISPNDTYIALHHSVWGDLRMAMGDPDRALVHFMASLDFISKHQSRIGLQVELLQKVSAINKARGNYELAYEQLSRSKALGDSLFGSRSDRNIELFEVKDSYRKAVLAHQRTEREQQLRLLKVEKEKLRDSLTFAVVLLFVIVSGAVVVYRLVKRKHIIEKKLEHERASAELEVKNKELTVTALQLIEKDQLLEEVKDGLSKVQEQGDKKSITQIKQVIRHNSMKTWEEFEARFVQVNNKFYESLAKKHQGLSPNELKLCALVKLNFSSKEMAQLMGVSPESINKARYRLRKKLNLNREDNLVAYINTI